MIRKRDILEGVRINGKVVSMRQVGNGADASKPDTAKLARLISAYAPHDGSFDLRIPGLHASRFSRVNTEQLCRILEAAFGSNDFDAFELRLLRPPGELVQIHGLQIVSDDKPHFRWKKQVSRFSKEMVPAWSLTLELVAAEQPPARLADDVSRLWRRRFATRRKPFVLSPSDRPGRRA
jgi:hypothetical protein